MKLLTARDVELLHMQIIDASGGSHGTRNAGRIKAAVATAQQTAFGQEVYTSIFDKAAALLRGIALDHPFIDGNKRTAVMSALLLLNLNDHDTSGLTDTELEDFAVSVVTNKLDVPQIAEWLEAHTRK